MIDEVKIKSIRARMVINSRGEPTVKVDLITDLDDRVHSASAPSGASKSGHAARELRDNGSAFGGLGVDRAIDNVNQIIAPELKGQNVLSQGKIDEALIELDGHIDKSRLGANAILPVSLAVCRAAATACEQPLWQYLAGLYRKLNAEAKISLPRPCFNVINGGMHAGSRLDFQEFMIVPQGKDYQSNLTAGVELYRELKNILIEEIGPTAINIGDEGGFTPSIAQPESALDLIGLAMSQLDLGFGFKIGLDCAAETFFKDDHYFLTGKSKSREAMIDYYQKLTEDYPIIFLEDPLAQNDWTGWAQIKDRLVDKIDIMGDDLLATNPERMREANQADAVSGTIIKPNQIGSLTETLRAVALASSFGWRIMVSHRSGDTNDDFIADLAVGVGADYFKSGAPARGERIAKYNRLSEIESEIKENG